MKKVTIKKGDQVRIVRSRFIKRVGYPLVFTELREEFENHPRFFEAMRMLGVIPEVGNQAAMAEAMPYYAKRDAVAGLAKAAVRVRRWGGPERSIHYIPTADPKADELFGEDTIPDRAGQVTEVYSKRIRMTGTYYAPWSGVSYEGEHDYEPGGLSNMRAHVILSTGLGDIEDCDVELVAA